MTDPTDPLDDWLLTSAERGNDATRLVDRVPGNACTPLVHGATYFARLVEEVEALAEGDHLFFTDWRGDAWQRLGDDGPTVGALFSDAARRGVVVRGLVWRSHSEMFTLNKEANQGLDTDLEESGGQVILDQRVHRFGSHHQKLVVLRHPSEPERDVAFIGGIDLCNSRRDDARHLGDPQALAMAQAYGATPAWHDVQLEVRARRWPPSTASSGSGGRTPPTPTRTTPSLGSSTPGRARGWTPPRSPTSRPSPSPSDGRPCRSCGPTP